MRNEELTLLMSAITNRERLDTLMERNPDDLFTDPDALVVFDSLRAMIGDGVDPDLPTLAVRLQDTQGDRAGAIISEITKAPVTVNFLGLMSELSRHRSRRRIQDFARNLFDTIKNGADLESATAILTKFQDKMTILDPDVFTSMRDLAAGDLDDIFTNNTATPTGIDAIDGYIPGLYAGQLIILAARPGVGKTSLALQVANNLPGNSLFFSLEMPKQDIFARHLSGIAEVEAWKIDSGKVTDTEARRVLDAQDKVKQTTNDLIIVDKLSDVYSIINAIQRFNRRGKVSGVFIDYLQLMSGGRGETHNLRIADITRRMKLAAMEYSVPFVLMSQLSRANEHQSREPVLSDLRDSGAIEQDADVVIFLHENDDGTQLIFAKNRKGRTGKTSIKFEKCYTRFKEVP